MRRRAPIDPDILRAQIETINQLSKRPQHPLAPAERGIERFYNHVFQEADPGVGERATNNHYMIPAQVLSFMDSYNMQDAAGNDIPMIDQADRLNCTVLVHWVSSLIGEAQISGTDDSVVSKALGYLTADTRTTVTTEEFVKTEFLAMLYAMLDPTESKSQIDTYFTPVLESNIPPKLAVPVGIVRDLPTFLLLFLLLRIAQASEAYHNSNLHVCYNVTVSKKGVNNFTTGTAIRVPNDVIVHRDNYMTMRSLFDLYLEIYKTIWSSLPQSLSGQPEQNGMIWNGSEGSGTTMVLHGIKEAFLIVQIVFMNNRNQDIGRQWNPAVEEFLNTTVGDSIISVRNRHDDRCLLYCIVIGLLTKIRDPNGAIFGRNVRWIEDSEVYAKGLYMFTDDTPISVLIRRLARCLFAQNYAGGPPDMLIRYIDELDTKVHTSMSVQEFRRVFKDIETTLIPNKLCGIDVYGIDYNINPHIYPLYISKTREHTIALLCVTLKDRDCSHFCLINNMETLLKGSGGKQFFSCSKCGQCFYHRRLLADHNCPAGNRLGSVDGEGGYHYSVKDVDPNVDVIVGSCPKCRLCFISNIQYQYHMEHCLMRNKTGFRHVQLVSYKPDEHPVLTGESIDMEQENKHVRQRRIFYADFESSIDPNTGVHTFMSYGLYDWKGDRYYCGYDLQEMFDRILDIAFSNDQDRIYVYFHNAMNYDANFVLRHVLNTPEYSDWGIKVIMKSANRLQKLAFYVMRDHKKRVIQIGDTFLFLTLSLERIVSSIRKDDLALNKENFARFFKIFHERYPGVSDEDIDHILRKNIFPYNYFTDASKLNVDIEDFKRIFEPLDENLKFFSERVTKDDLARSYDDTVNVMTKFECHTVRDYHDLYLCCDVMQLADVFDRSMQILWDSHHIHLPRYLGMPSASWAAFLRHDPSMRIPLYEDTFFAEFFKEMIRGGITSAALRHATADSNHSIIYLDVNGLYPYVMQRYDFPCGQFRYVPLNFHGDDCVPRLQHLFDVFEQTHTGMCFCVDLHITDAVKQLTDMYPFAPEHRIIYDEYFADAEHHNLTPALQKWSDVNDGETMMPFLGLVCTLYDKIKYNVHWRVLKFYIEHGVVVQNVWFGVSFQEGDYLAGYIRKNIAIRNTRKDELGKTLYKLLGNSIYGKTFESPFKRNTYEIIRDPAKLEGLMEEQAISAMTPIDDLGWVVKLDGEDIFLDKPTFIGACVCEFSKLHMYTLLYDNLMRIFPGTPDDPGCVLVYTDTDSFILRVRHPPELEGNEDPHALFDYIKRMDPGLIGGIGGQIKSETGEDDTIQEVIALRSKVYAYITKQGKEGKHAKGVTYDAQAMQLNWQIFKNVLESMRGFSTTNIQFLRQFFGVKTLPVIRQSLTANDGKREILPDGIHTHAFGYH